MIKNNVRDYLIPTKLEMFLYFIVTAVILLIANFKYFASYSLVSSGTSQAGQDAFQLYTTSLFELIEGLPFVPSGAVFIFWSLMGLVIFSLAQSVYNVYAELKGDLNIHTHFLHPSNYTRWQFWGEVSVQFTAHLLLYALIVLWSLLMGFILTPLGALLAQRFFTDISIPSLIAFGSSYILLYIGVIVFALLLKLFFKRKHLMI